MSINKHDKMWKDYEKLILYIDYNLKSCYSVAKRGTNCLNKTLHCVLLLLFIWKEIAKMSKRVKQIKDELAPFCPDMNSLYTNQEIVDILKNLQDALSKGVFEKSHAAHLHAKDILIHFDALASEYNLTGTDTYNRFKSNMNELGYTIGSFIKGMKGEKLARHALKRLSYRNDIEILYNVQLEHEDCFAEYDAIIITKYGLFVIEVKNWNAATVTPDGIIINDQSNNKYDMLGRFSVKEAILREYLGEKFPDFYTNILMFPNLDAKIVDQYHNIPIVLGSGISYTIETYFKSKECISGENVVAIKEIILKNQKDQLTYIPVNCEQIISDYAELMADIEKASSKSEQPENASSESKNTCSTSCDDSKAFGLAAGLVAIVSTALGYAVLKHYKK